MAKLDPVDSAARTAKAHRTYVLNSRKVLDYLRAHEGATNAEIRAATGHSPLRLQSAGMAKWKRDAEGVVRWYVVDTMARPWAEKKLAEAEREIEGTRWVKYVNK